jgi:sarcosine oxidase subunit beta
LWIAYSDTQLCQLEKNVELQNSLGIDSKVLTPEEIQEVAPHLNT